MTRLIAGLLGALLLPLAVGALHLASAAGGVFAARRDAPPVAAPPRPHDPARPTAVVVLSSRGTVVSDALAPFEILSATGAFNVYTVAAQPAAVPLSGGLDVVPDLTLAQLDARLGGRAPQVVVVPAMADDGAPPVAAWLRGAAARGSLLMSVCNGAEVLASAGLLDGRRATAHWSAVDSYASAYPATEWLRGRRFVEDGADRITTAGLLAGVDGTLRVVERLLGTAAAARAAAAVGWPRFVPGPARPGVPVEHTSADAAVLLDAGFSGDPTTVGVALTPGVGELELASVFETYGAQAFTTRTLALSAGGGPVVTRHGLAVVPRGDVVTAEVGRLLVPGADRVPVAARVAPEYVHEHGAFAYDPVLTDVGRHLDVATARWIGKGLEYPTDRLDLQGAAWPWAALAQLAGLAALGAAAGDVLARRVVRRRRVAA